MEGPNKAIDKRVSRGAVKTFHRDVEIKRGLQTQERYRRLWWRKATLELRPFLMRYVRWFFVRVLKIKTVLGTREEIANEHLEKFR